MPEQFLRNLLPVYLDVGVVGSLADLTEWRGNRLDKTIFLADYSRLNPLDDACLMNEGNRAGAFAEFHENLALIETDTAARSLNFRLRECFSGRDRSFRWHMGVAVRGNNNILLWSSQLAKLVLLHRWGCWGIKFITSLYSLVHRFSHSYWCVNTNLIRIKNYSILDFVTYWWWFTWLSVWTVYVVLDKKSLTPRNTLPPLSRILSALQHLKNQLLMDSSPCCSLSANIQTPLQSLCSFRFCYASDNTQLILEFVWRSRRRFSLKTSG